MLRRIWALVTVPSSRWRGSSTGVVGLGECQWASVPSVSPSQTVRLPRARRPVSYSRQFRTREAVWTCFRWGRVTLVMRDLGSRGGGQLLTEIASCAPRHVHTLPEKTGDDATTAVDLLTAVEGPLVRVTADAASATVAVYETATARGETVVIPPARTANVSGHGPRSPARDRTIMVVKTLGRRRWKKVSGYHRQGRVENTFFRHTSIIGDVLRARSPAGQGSEAVLGCEILNRMTALGRPVSYRVRCV